MSKKVRVTPEIIQTVKEINDNHHERFYWEIGQRVGVCDDTVMRILHNEYRIEGNKVVRIYKKPNGSKAFSVTLNDICEKIGQIREALTGLSDTLK